MRCSSGERRTPSSNRYGNSNAFGSTGALKVIVSYAMTTQTYDHSDFRTVGGIRVAFATAVTVPMLGRVVMAYDTITFNAPVDPKAFELP